MATNTPPHDSTLDTILARLDGIDARLVRIEEAVGRRGALTHFYHLHLAVQSLVRGLFLDASKLAFPDRLLARRFRLRSQNYEDGITQAILELGAEKTRTAVEIGCGVNGGNTGFLVAECGWRGLFLDASASKIEVLRGGLSRKRATVAQAMVTAENVNDLLRSHGFDGEVDVLSLDIDGVDYWVWRALTAVSPRLVIVEYNSAFGADRAVSVPYDPAFSRASHKLYFGASLPAFVRLAASKNYRLVAAEPRGVNAFFVRHDVATEIPACEVGEAYRLLDKSMLKLGSRSVESFLASLDAQGLPLVECSD